jgi:hypothetical protein
MTPFYRAFKETSNITTAFEALESERGSKKLFQIFHSEKFFLLTFARQLRHMTTGKTGAMRIEGLLTQAMNGGVPNTREKRRELRTTFKTYIRKPEISYDSMTRIFLHGRKTASFEDVYRFVRADIESRRLDVVAQAQE